MARHVAIGLATMLLVVGSHAPTAQEPPKNVAQDGHAIEERERAGEESPHVEALRLVFRTQPEAIRKVDSWEWWFDTELRTWVVKRPIPPGIFDSTHSFIVVYNVGGRDVAEWGVDTKVGRVTSVRLALGEKVREESDLARDLRLSQVKVWAKDPHGFNKAVRTLEARAAIGRLFERLRLVGMTRDDVIWALGRPDPLTPGADAPLVYEFPIDDGSTVLRYTVAFKKDVAVGFEKNVVTLPDE